MFLMLICIYKPAFSDITFEGANNEIVILTGAVLSNTTNCEQVSNWNVAES